MIKWAIVYLSGTILQICLVCLVIYFLKKRNFQYGKFLSIIFLALGGLSSAVWGAIVSKSVGRVDSYFTIVKAFFDLKQPILAYLLVLVPILIMFGKQMLLSKKSQDVKFYTYTLLFLQSLVFGGVEEIGWRYTFQPILEQKIPFEIATVLTFISWAIWHNLFFYMSGTISKIDHIAFLMTLLSSCFILGAIFNQTNSLWLCVLYHCLLNMFSQTLKPLSKKQSIITTIIIIIVSILIVRINICCY